MDVKAALIDCNWDIGKTSTFSFPFFSSAVFYGRRVSSSSLIGLWVDVEAAQTELRKRGNVLASKKSARTAAEGLLAQNETKAAVIELNCETDFVARNDIFQIFVKGESKNGYRT